MRIIQMKCPGCGAGLGINTEVDNFSCQYCRSHIQVVHQGGTIYLENIEGSVGDIKSHTAKIAAEMAMVRLKEELQALRSPRSTGLSPYDSLLSSSKRELKLLTPNRSLWIEDKKSQTRTHIIWHWWSLVIFISFFVGWLFFILGSFAVLAWCAWILISRKKSYEQKRNYLLREIEKGEVRQENKMRIYNAQLDVFKSERDRIERQISECRKTLQS